MLEHLPRGRTSLAAAVLLALLGVSPTTAQSRTGSLVGTVADPSGTPLAGVTVTLTGVGAARTQLTDNRGQFRFLGLDPGDRYEIEARLAGFSVLEHGNITVQLNRSSNLALQLSPAQFSETLTVSSESPVLDSREVQTGTQISQQEIASIPAGRDAYALLNQASGVLMDRQTVGGSDRFGVPFAGGASFRQNDWVLDGVSVTDPNNGASRMLYDMDQFTEIAIAIGGTDVAQATPGVTVNLATKRGSDEFRGSARFYRAKAEGFFGGLLSQAQPDIGPDDLAPGQEEFQVQSIRETREYGFEAGGALIRSRLWLWGSWSSQERLYDHNNVLVEGDEEHTALKLNAQLTEANSAVASYNDSDPIGLDWNGGILKPGPATWDQRGPASVLRFEDTHLVSPSLFVSGTFAYQDPKFELAARGGVGPEALEAWRGTDGVWRDNYQSGSVTGPTNSVTLDTNYFFHRGALSHELRIGGRLRQIERREDWTWPGRNVFRYNTGVVSFQAAMRGTGLPVEMEYLSLWLQDTLTAGRATVNLGVRYDEQSGTNRAGVVPANPAVPHVLPALEFGGASEEFHWRNVLPRIGFTYALGSGRDTLIRASLSQFADQLGQATVRRTNPAGTAYAYFIGDYVEGPPQEDWSEFDDPSQVFFAEGFDPADPAALESPNVTDPGLAAPLTTELLIGVEHALLPELVLGLQLTYRDIDGVLEEVDLLRDLDTGEVRMAGLGDYQLGGVATGTIPGTDYSYRVPLFDFTSNLVPTGGSRMFNGPRSRTHEGASLTLTKRLADRWMARGYVHYDQTRWNVPLEYHLIDSPNRTPGDRDGDLYIPGTGGSNRGERFVQSSWSFNLNGLYQLFADRPWGFNVSGNLQGREGFALPYWGRFLTERGQIATVTVVDEVDDFRLEDLYQVDLRLEKDVSLKDPISLTFGIDCFNVLNAGTGLARSLDVTAGTTNYLLDAMAPRVYRLSLRLSWR